MFMGRDHETQIFSGGIYSWHFHAPNVNLINNKSVWWTWRRLGGEHEGDSGNCSSLKRAQSEQPTPKKLKILAGKFVRLRLKIKYYRNLAKKTDALLQENTKVFFVLFKRGMGAWRGRGGGRAWPWGSGPSSQGNDLWHTDGCSHFLQQPVCCRKRGR